MKGTGALQTVGEIVDICVEMFSNTFYVTRFFAMEIYIMQCNIVLLNKLPFIHRFITTHFNFRQNWVTLTSLSSLKQLSREITIREWSVSPITVWCSHFHQELCHTQWQRYSCSWRETWSHSKTHFHIKVLSFQLCGLPNMFMFYWKKQ